MNSENSPSRRRFLHSAAALGGAVLASNAATVRAAANKNSKLRIFQIGTGGIGGMQRKGLKGHPMVEFAGFCDTDETMFSRIEDYHGKPWTVTDYREAFANKLGDFDAVIVDTPDFHHCPMMVTALKNGKHVYGQKPLVHQLDELRVIQETVAARPDLYTQMGNQRACVNSRMQATELLRSNRFGRPVEAYIWVGGMSRGTYFVDPWSEYGAEKPVPETTHWDLWNGPLTKSLPYSEDLHPRRWRSYWETGGGMLADWGCHVIDTLYFAYDLPSPEAVVTHTIKPAGVCHSGHNQSIITYPGGDNFAREKFVLHFNDSGIKPSFAALGLPEPGIKGTCTMVVCEEGTILIEPGGKFEIYRKGKLVENEPLPEVAPRNHWKDWADCALGTEKPLWTPFDIGARITEPALLATKATRYPGQELRWDGKSYKFTNSEKANETILSRKYREGFAPPSLG
ncbi:MAG: Gfo/Idh/MocA family oxidoreductase [Verrucomicrobiales bacterium]|jgi:predicted dehydrogenase|nr:Gfo/Idh/MocA family oxidoreductase [Verrucomicrobiales bacterium]